MFRNIFATAFFALCVVPSSDAQIRCGAVMPTKQEIERVTTNLDTARFFNVIRDQMHGLYEGYAVIFTATSRVLELFRNHPCVAILGPRQCGKTTLARMICSEETVFTLSERLA